MNIIQQPDGLSLSYNIRDFRISSTEAVSFVLKKGATELVAQTYEPGQDGYVTVKVRDIVHAQLSLVLQNINAVYEQTGIVADFTAVINSTEIIFRVIRAGVDNLADTAANFLTANWLTWQPQEKSVTYSSPEFLTYYAVVAGICKLKAYYTNKSGAITSEETLTVATLTAGKAYTIPTQYASISALVGGKLPAFYDIWIEDGSGNRLTYIQRYYAGNMKSEQEDWILFENSLGGIDTFRAYGVTEFTGEHTHNIAEIDEVSEEYRIDTERKYKKNTGYLNERERRWLLDFFPSSHKMIYTAGALRSIVVTDSDVTYKDKELPSSYTFTYKFSSAQPLLNITRSAAPSEVLNISIPDLGNFTVPPRLIELDSLPLTEGALFLVQSPYDEEWKTTTPYKIAEFIAPKLAELLGVKNYKEIDLIKENDTTTVAADDNTFSAKRILKEISSIDIPSVDLSGKLDKSIFDAFFTKENVGTEESPVWAIKANYGLYTDHFLSAKDKNIGSGSGGGSTSLGGLNNVGSWADEVPTVDRIMVQLAGATHWSSKPLSEVVGLDTTALQTYLDNNNYAKKSDIPSLSSYATQDWVTNKGYLSSSALNGYATQSWVTNQSYATQSALNAVSSKVDNFLEGSDTDGIINKWKELEAFLSGQTQSNTLADLLAVKADKNIEIKAGTGLTGGGTLSATRTLSLAATGTAGTYTKVTTDAYGRVTSGSSLAASDIPALGIDKISGLQSALNNKLDIAYFKRVFGVLDANDNELSGNDMATVIASLKLKVGTWTEEYFSVKGQNPGSGGSVSLALSQLADISLSSPGNGESLVYSTSLGKWINGAAGLSKVTVKLGSISYDSVDGTVYLPTYPTSLPANDVYNWAKQSNKPSYIWDEIGGKPATFAPSAHTHSFASLTGIPTTLSGYGITDAFKIVTVASGNDIALSGYQGGYWGGIGSYASFVQSGYNYGGQLQFSSNGIAQRYINNGSIYYSWRRLLDDSNYNSYSPTLTGLGASGTWGINITGYSSGSNWLLRNTAISGQIGMSYNVLFGDATVGDTTISGQFNIPANGLGFADSFYGNAQIVRLHWDAGSSYYTDLLFGPNTGINDVWYKKGVNNSVNPTWYYFITSKNFSSQTGLDGRYVLKTGDLINGTFTTYTNGTNSYNQGVRINRLDIGKWATLTIGYVGNSTSGTSANTWLIATPQNSNNLIFNNNAADETIGLKLLSGHPNNGILWNNNIVWHSGNDGVGSGLDADLFGGLHNASFLRSDSYSNPFNSLVIGQTNFYCTSLRSTGTPIGYKILTKIPSSSDIPGNGMFTVYIKGYAYGNSFPIDIQVIFYQYGGFVNYGYVNKGSWGPTIQLARENGYVAINLKGGIYYNQFTVSCDMGQQTDYNSKLLGWSVVEISSEDGYATEALVTLQDRGILSNAVSATKLFTPRTIFGRSFDGTGDVIGDMTNVGRLTMSGYLRIGGSYDLSSAWDAGLIAGADAHTKVVASYLASGTNCATIGAHVSALNGWAELNLAGTQLRFSIQETPKMYLTSTGLGIGVMPSYALQINGTGYFSGSTTLASTLSVSGNVTFSSYLNSALYVTNLSDHVQFRLAGVHTVSFGGQNDGYAHRSYYFRPAVSTSGVTYSTLYIQNCQADGATYSTTHVFDYNGNAAHSGYATASRFYAGYDSTQANSMSCSNWFRSSGTTGWINATYGGGIYMEDTTYVRVYGGKSFYVPNEIYAGVGIWTDGYLSGKGQNTTSDITKKNILKDTIIAVKDIARAPSFEFTWKDGFGGLEIGTSAQYWQKVLPSSVKEFRGALTLNYGAVALLSSIAIAKKVVNHEDRIKALEKENAQLKKKISNLERRLYA